MTRRIEKISATLASVLHKRGLIGRLKEYRLFSRWKDIAGEAIALHARPVLVRRNKLYVVVDSSVWAQQLFQLKPELIEKINKSLGKDAIRDIIFKTGEIEVTNRIEPVKATSASSLDPEEAERVESYIKGIEDNDLKLVLRRLIEKDMISKKRRGSLGP